jgi:hypothetical protein
MGENRGPEHYARRTAYDLKALHKGLRELPDDTLKQIPVVDSGQRLELGAAYFDLAHPERGEFRGMNDQEAGPDECLVPKSGVDFELWNRLTGIQNPDRLGRFTTEEAA